MEENIFLTCEDCHLFSKLNWKKKQKFGRKYSAIPIVYEFPGGMCYRKVTWPDNIPPYLGK